ncbi:acetyl-CoA hydrolase/transferase C-terminal domain-containing protein [Haloglomus litoreum]|uniref:acetyl-CoA hydrolase/transferase C-terminal domain-containing protein n=1 Tax=Haloglomus litoreum TaxID=3034026 RepID=UPI0023E77786|nr:acetyl-CoA hydrolase/transferase C-terminal domain-containing protein [Haloglomus sp. DT116]
MTDDGTGGRIEGDLPVESATDAAARIEAGDVLGISGFGSVGYPKLVPEALAARGDAAALDLTVISGGSVGPEVDEALVESDAMARRYPFIGHEALREAINDGVIAFHDRHVAGVADEVRFGGLPAPDWAIVEAVAVGEDWLVPSPSVGSTPTLVDAADRLVVEVNAAQPRDLEGLHDLLVRAAPPGREPLALDAVDDRIGSTRIDFDPGKLAAVVHTDRADTTYTFRDPTAVDRALADQFAGFLDAELDRNPAFADSLNLQFGVGSVGNAVVSALDAVDLGAGDVAYFGEVVQDAVLDALDDGTLAAASATSLALSDEGQDRLFANLDRYAEQVVLRPVDVSNDAGLIDSFGVIAVNGAVEVDLTGQVNSTHIGTDVVGGVGGSGDFFRAALLSVVALPSTAAGGDISRVVPRVAHVDHTEHDVDVVVTDQGVADLRGLSPRERMRAMLDVAHPDFREALTEYHEQALERGGHTPGGFDLAAEWPPDDAT